MIRSFFLLIFLLLFSSMRSQEAPGIFFVKASNEEFFEIMQRIDVLSAEEQFEAGLYEDLDKAIEDNKNDMYQTICDNPNQKYYCLHLVSKDFCDPCGYLVYSITEQNAFLIAIFLEIPCRGLGLGKKVLKELETEVKAKNCREIKLYVFEHNKAAFMLYTKMGYEIEKTYTDDRKIIGHHMKKTFKND